MIEILDERKRQVYKKGDEVFDLACDKASLAGSVSQRACVFCGSRVVLYPIADAVHLVHGPIGCAAYTWDIRGSLSSGPELHRLSFSTDLQGRAGDLRRGEEALCVPHRADYGLSTEGGLRLRHLHHRPHRRRRAGGLQKGRKRAVHSGDTGPFGGFQGNEEGRLPGSLRGALPARSARMTRHPFGRMPSISSATSTWRERRGSSRSTTGRWA